MQVANDVTSANELPSREARALTTAAAGKLQGGELREDCALWSVVSLAKSVWGSQNLAV